MKKPEGHDFAELEGIPGRSFCRRCGKPDVAAVRVRPCRPLPAAVVERGAERLTALFGRRSVEQLGRTSFTRDPAIPKVEGARPPSEVVSLKRRGRPTAAGRRS